MIEVELKFRTNAQQQAHIKRQLKHLSPRIIVQSDKIFLLKSRSFENFKIGDPVIRLRTTPGSTTLTYKRALHQSEASLEHELAIDSSAVAEQLIGEWGFKPVTLIEKTRTEYHLADLTIALDDVNQLGLFVEIEILCAPGEETATKARLLAKARTLGLTTNALETLKYDQLISQKDAANQRRDVD